MATVYRILIADYDDLDAFLVQKELRQIKQAVTLLRVTTKDRFATAMQNFKPHLVIAKCDFDCWNLVNMAKELMPSIPFIVVAYSASQSFLKKLQKFCATQLVMAADLVRIGQHVENVLCHLTDNKVAPEEESDAGWLQSGMQLVQPGR